MVLWFWGPLLGRWRISIILIINEILIWYGSVGGSWMVVYGGRLHRAALVVNRSGNQRILLPDSIIPIHTGLYCSVLPLQIRQSVEVFPIIEHVESLVRAGRRQHHPSHPPLSLEISVTANH